MPLTLTEKQTLFINELVLDFEDNIKKLNDENRNRSDAREGFVQNALNTTLGLTSNIGLIGLVASTVTSAGFNKVKGKKQEKRREGISAHVTTQLETTIHDVIKIAATKLFIMLHEFLAETADSSVKTIADCISDRMINYMTKMTNGNSALDFWSADNFILGAFLGRSGRFKQGAFNTAIERENEEMTRLKSFFNANASTVEGLLAHSVWASKDDAGHWVYSHHKKDNPFKYGLLVVPFYVMEAEVKNRFFFEPSSVSLAPYQARLESDWIEIHEVLSFVPTQTNDALSETLAEHQQHLNEMHTIVVQLEQQVKASSTYQEEMSHIIAEYHDNTRQKRWNHLKKTVVNTREEADFYVQNVNAWLVDLSVYCDCDVSEMVDLLSRVALLQYPEDKKLILTPKENEYFKHIPETFKNVVDFMRTHFMEEYCPVLVTSVSFQWNPLSGKALQGYFQAIGLWTLYQNTNNDWSLPALWTDVAWDNASFVFFLNYFLPKQVFERLARQWCENDQNDQHYFLSSNIAQATKFHVEACSDRNCSFCSEKINWVRRKIALKDELECVPNDSHGVCYLKPAELPDDISSPYAGFSPEQPYYLDVASATNKTLPTWSEQYISQLYHEAAIVRLHKSNDVHDMATFTPILLLRQKIHYQMNLAVHREIGQLLKDKADYIDEMVKMFQLEKNGDSQEKDRFIMTYIEARKILRTCQETYFLRAKNARFNLKDENCSSMSDDDFSTRVLEKELIYPLDENYFVLQQKSQRVEGTESRVKRSESVDSKHSVQFLHWIHEHIMQRNPNLDAHKIQAIVSDMEANQSAKTICLTQQAQLENNQMPEQWRLAYPSLTKKEVALVIESKNKLLNMRLMVIENYLKGSGLLAEGFEISSVEAWEQQSAEDALAQRYSEASGPTSPLLRQFSSEPFSTEQKERSSMLTCLHPAFSATELFHRSLFFEAGFFWFNIQKRFEKDPLGYQEYKEKLVALIEQLPKIQPVLAQYVGKTETKALEKPLDKWSDVMKSHKKNLLKDLASWEEKNKLIEEQRAYHEAGERLRWEFLLDRLDLSVEDKTIKKVFESLPTDEQKWILRGLEKGNVNPASTWFSEVFSGYQGEFFLLYLHESLVEHFYQTFSTYVLSLSPEIQEKQAQDLNSGKFALAYQVIEDSFDKKATYFEKYKNHCHSLFFRFTEIHQVWNTVDLATQERLITEGFQTGNWREFSTLMEGQWRRLSPMRVKQLLQQGLHPDSTLRGRNLIDEALQSLNQHMTDMTSSAEDRLRGFEKHIERIAYLLNSEVTVNAWDRFEEEVNNTKESSSRLFSAQLSFDEQRMEASLWSRLASITQLFQQFSANPESKKKAEETLNVFDNKLQKYWQEFEIESLSWRMRWLGKLFRKSTVLDNRKEQYLILKDVAKNIPLYYAHMYLYLQLIHQTMQSTTHQLLPSSRLKSITKELLKELEKLVINWRELIPAVNNSIRLVDMPQGMTPRSQIMTTLPRSTASFFYKKADEKVQEKLAKAEKRAADETKRAADETKRADDEKKRAADETKRADDEKKRADNETKNKDKLARKNAKILKKLAFLGIPADEFSSEEEKEEEINEKRTGFERK